jgi:nucleoside-diphosphate-sugar epimerase
MSRTVCVTSVDGHTGFLVAELLLTNETFKSNIKSVTGLTLHPHAEKCKELAKLGVKIVPHEPGRLKHTVQTLQQVGAEALCLIPPAHKDKFDITMEMIEAAKQANIANVCFVSSAGCDLAERDKQPHLRSFIDLEAAFMASKGDSSTSTGHSPVVVRYPPPFLMSNFLKWQ